MAEKEIRQARAVVREREKAIWNGVETAGREARAADASRVAASAASRPQNTPIRRVGEVQRPG